MKSDRLKGQVAVITGAGSGLNQGIAYEFAQNGCIVAVADVDEVNGKATADKIVAEGGEAFFVKMNIGDTKSVNTGMKEVYNKTGKITILINGAAISRFHQLSECTDEEWELMINVDLTGTFRTLRAVFPYMKENGGRIINISSTSGKSGGSWSGAHYVAAKAGVIGLARYCAKEWAKYGILANAICPGVADTPLTAEADKGKTDAMLKAIPLGRKCTPADVAGVAMFLCSEEGSYVTGITVDVAGGRYIYNN
ncbi:MAG: SDR family oxidoreductase [Lachnospiraceae bacterium]|nr:SDR family oxidoreductase [Lachnospiraceae bacterium]